MTQFLSTFTGSAGATNTPTPSGTTFSNNTTMGSVVNSANTSSANEVEAINKAADYAEANNLTANEVASQLGMTVAEVTAKLAKAGRTLPTQTQAYKGAPL